MKNEWSVQCTEASIERFSNKMGKGHFRLNTSDMVQENRMKQRVILRELVSWYVLYK